MYKRSKTFSFQLILCDEDSAREHGVGIKPADNIPIVEHSKIIKRWKEFYSILYHSDRATFDYIEEDPNKEPGPDGIMSEMHDTSKATIGTH